MSKILLMAESGSEITPELAGQLGVFIVPMHVTVGGETRDDGAFPVTQMFEHYKATREPPRTSGCTPHDFEVAFGRALEENPGAQILYLAYSACTTCSMQSAIMTADGRKDIRIVDTKSVSAGQMAVVMRVAVVPASLSRSASHFDFVRLAIQISSKTLLFWQHLWMATDATPPQPMISAFPIGNLLFYSVFFLLNFFY